MAETIKTSGTNAPAIQIQTQTLSDNFKALSAKIGPAFHSGSEVSVLEVKAEVVKACQNALKLRQLFDLAVDQKDDFGKGNVFPSVTTIRGKKGDKKEEDTYEW